MTLLNISNLIKRYGDQVILEHNNLQIPQGIHLLVGANGSGKSTFLKILAGLIPFEGEILLFDQILLNKDHREHRLRVGYAESEPHFPPYLPGEYLVQMLQELKGSNLKEVTLLCQYLGIQDFLTQKISGYSSGMKKKLALLLAFMGSSELILLDEPFNALDAQAKVGLENLISQYSKEGKHFIIATHIHGNRPNLPLNSEIQLNEGRFHFQNLTA